MGGLKVGQAELDETSPAPKKVTVDSEWVELVRDDRGKFCKTDTLPAKYCFQSGVRKAKTLLTRDEFVRLLKYQVETPAAVMSDTKNSTWWMFRGKFYWDNQGYTADEIKAIATVQTNGLEPFDQQVSWLLLVEENERRLERRFELQQQYANWKSRQDAFVRRREELQRQMNRLNALVEWGNSYIEADMQVSEALLVDQLDMLGFTSKDIQEFKTTPEANPATPQVNLVDRVNRWGQALMDVVADTSAAQVVRLNEHTATADATILAMIALTAEFEEASAKIEQITVAIRSETFEPSPETSREPIPDSMRQAVLGRDGGACRYCGERAVTFHLDHVIPVAQGGRSTVENLVTACARCIRQKAARAPEEAGMTLWSQGAHQ